MLEKYFNLMPHLLYSITKELQLIPTHIASFTSQHSKQICVQIDEIVKVNTMLETRGLTFRLFTELAATEETEEYLERTSSQHAVGTVCGETGR